jgi:hypothetical protein
MDLTTTLIVSMVALVVVILGVILLNQSQSSAGQKLVGYLKPYEVAFETRNKRTYASGLIKKIWTVLYVQPKGGGDESRLRMRSRINLPTAPRFYLSTNKTRKWLMKNEHREAKDWPRVDERFVVQVLDRDVQSQDLVAALSPETIQQIDTFDTTFDGILVYSIDANLFDKSDAEMLRLYPELRHELVLFTHIEVNSKLTTQQFQQFVDQSIVLAQSLENDLRKIFKQAESTAPDKSRALRLQRFS